MAMKYKNVVTIYDAIEGAMPLDEALEQMAEAVPQVYPTAKYQAQYDSIMDGTIAMPPYRSPQPTKASVRRMLMQHAKSQMFAAIEDLQEQSSAIADFVRMSEERAYQDAIAQWEKGRDDFNRKIMSNWQEYAKSMKPLLENDPAILTKALTRHLHAVELPVTCDVSFEVRDESVYLQIDGSDMSLVAVGAEGAEADEANAMDVADAVSTSSIDDICRYLATGLAGVAIAATRIVVELTGENGEILHEYSLER